MRAFVFSGGANRGSLQAGAAHALVESGIVPDFVVGSSVGSINAAALALIPSLQGVEAMNDHWRTVGAADIFPGNRMSMMLRMMQKRGSLHTNRAFYRFLGRVFGSTKRRFKDLRVPLFVTATRYDTGELHLFGTNLDERLIDAVMASCAVPPYFPPYEYNDHVYIDGGFVSNLPIAAAINQGATEIWALEIGSDILSDMPQRGIINALSRSMKALMRLQMQQELELVRSMQQKRVAIHHVRMLHYSFIDVRDFRWNAALMDLGYQSALSYLNSRKQLATAHPESPVVKSGFSRAALKESTHRYWESVQGQAGALRDLLPLGNKQMPVEAEASSAIQQSQK